MKNMPIYIGTSCGTVAKLTCEEMQEYTCIDCKNRAVGGSRIMSFCGRQVEEDILVNIFKGETVTQYFHPAEGLGIIFDKVYHPIKFCGTVLSADELPRPASIGMYVRVWEEGVGFVFNGERWALLV